MWLLVKICGFKTAIILHKQTSEFFQKEEKTTPGSEFIISFRMTFYIILKKQSEKEKK